jgi:GT2 family glycosyltransferase
MKNMSRTDLDSPLVSIVILNYNAGELLFNCIKSIINSNYLNYEIILVDNNSTDKSHIECKQKFKEIKVIENGENLGYCEGNNIGIRNAKGKFIAILNPDTIVDKNWLKFLIQAYKEKGEGMYQPKFLSLYEKNVLQSTGNYIQLFGFGYARDKGEINSNKRNIIEEIGFASGTCLFTSKDVLDKTGLLDPFIFLYLDDLDLCWRAKQLGISSFFVPNSIVYHAESYILKWNSKKFYWLERNRKYCLLTHYSKNTLYKMLPTLIIIEILVFLFYLSKGFILEKIKADLNILKNWSHIKKRYFYLESLKKVEDKQIIKNFTDDIFVPKSVFKKSSRIIFDNIISKLSKKIRNKI